MGAHIAPTTEDVERALFALATHNGSYKRAARALKADGLTVSDKTLARWQEQHAQRYEEIHTEHIDRIQASLASQFEQNARQALEVQHRFIKQADALLTARQSKDAADATTGARNLGVVAGIGGQNARPLRDMPTVIRQHRSVDELVRALQRHGVMATDSTADDITDAQELVPAA